MPKCKKRKGATAKEDDDDNNNQPSLLLDRRHQHSYNNNNSENNKSRYCSIIICVILFVLLLKLQWEWGRDIVHGDVTAAIITSSQEGSTGVSNSVVHPNPAAATASSSSGLSTRLGTCSSFKIQTDQDRQDIDRVAQFHDVQNYILFLGFPRSGHSWIGSVLDAAPNAMVSNEHHALSLYELRRNNWKSREDLFRGIVKNSYLCGKYGRLQTYNYTLPGLWQGRIASNKKLQVIGDKHGVSSTTLLMKIGPTPWNNATDAQAQTDFFNDFLKFVQAEPKLIIVLRNPFNMIATRNLRRENAGNEQQQLPQVKDTVIEDTLLAFRQNLWAKDHLAKPHQWHIMTKERFGSHTREELKKLCHFTGIDCPPEMISLIEERTSHHERNTSSLVSWSDSQRKRVQEFIDVHLADYY